MVQLFNTAQLYLENQIQYNFHVPAISINTNPYQGLKQQCRCRSCLQRKISINTNPYQGLKQYNRLAHRLQGEYFN